MNATSLRTESLAIKATCRSPRNYAVIVVDTSVKIRRASFVALAELLELVFEVHVVK